VSKTLSKQSNTICRRYLSRTRFVFRISLRYLSHLASQIYPRIAKHVSCWHNPNLLKRIEFYPQLGFQITGIHQEVLRDLMRSLFIIGLARVLENYLWFRLERKDNYKFYRLKETD
jgi:hypothetical protein